MTEPASRPAAWVIAVSMGYGHQRTADPLRGLSPDGQVLQANDYRGIPDDDRAIWERTRGFYDFVSNIQRVPLVGDITFAAFDLVQRIRSFYPRRDLSRPDWNVRAIYALIRKGWGRDLIERLAQTTPVLPIVTSFFTPAFMAEHFEYPGEIYCAICDTDVARVWASLRPSKSRIRYFAPTRRVAERLGLYGVAPARVFTTGFPLPEENIGDASLGILKGDLAQRVVRLDPKGKYLDRYGALVAAKIGPLPPRADEPLTILFSIGGTGAQKEIGAALVESLRRRIARGDVKIVLAAGVKPAVRDHLIHAAAAAGFAPGAGDGVEVLFAGTPPEYFRRFNRALRTTDVLWTKPSELSFYTALGLPIVMAPPLGSQERANRDWLERLGAGVPQDNPRYADEWLFDLVESGWLAEAAMQGFIEGEQLGSAAIRTIIGSTSRSGNGGEVQ
jgi:hypothetical protein